MTELNMVGPPTLLQQPPPVGAGPLLRTHTGLPIDLITTETKVSDEYRPDVTELKKRLENTLPIDGLTGDCSAALDKRNRLNGIPLPPSMPVGPLLDSQGLILPRKPNNPYLDSRDRKDLNKELLFNQKIGKNVLNQKSELQRALEKHKDQQIRKEMELEKNQNKSYLERALEERARRLDQQVEKKEERSDRVPEFLQVHAKVRGAKEVK